MQFLSNLFTRTFPKVQFSPWSAFCTFPGLAYNIEHDGLPYKIYQILWPFDA